MRGMAAMSEEKSKTEFAPAPVVTNAWRVITVDVASAEKVLINLSGMQYEIHSVSIGAKSASDATPTAYIVAKSKGASEYYTIAATVTKSGDYITECECGVKYRHGAHPGAILGPCNNCFRDVRWTYEPFKKDGSPD